ncbi:type I-B CRISPR-associated protein Cas7/Csh2 [Dehalococcoidia bacterium]|nr:type I-B CRISPR-associated protein Cas7/Csh2 [Dehalococcoidia bacterium]MCL0102567.1 type I-B CRISPR-associated protein Cas7/Csh2 [Dehalococcoidia bacterium]
MTKATLSSRHEFLFLYDIKMGNPNGDPDENRPRVLPDGTHYVTDVRLKRFVRDFMKARGEDILVDNIEGRTTNLTGRVVDYLHKNKQVEANGQELVDILLEAFIDARLFGSSFAFKAEEVKGESTRKAKWTPVPKTMTGAVQLNMGEVLHRAEEVDIHGTSIFASAQVKPTGEIVTAGTFTTYFGLRYALIGFSGVANEHSAQISKMSEDDYDDFLKAMWHGVRSCGNTRTKVGQIPHLLIDIGYKQGEEFQFGRLHDYVKMDSTKDKKEKEWATPEDYNIDLSLLIERLQGQKDRMQIVRYAKSPDIKFTADLPSDWEIFDIESLPNKNTTQEATTEE